MLQACSWDSFVGFLYHFAWYCSCGRRCISRRWMQFSSSLLTPSNVLGEYLKTPPPKLPIICLWFYYIWKKEDTAVRIVDTPPDFNSIECLFQIYYSPENSCPISLFWTGWPDFWVSVVECQSYFLSATGKTKRPSFSLYGNVNMWAYLNFTVFRVCDQWLKAVICFFNSFYNNFNLLFSSMANSSLIFMNNLKMPLNYLSS